MPEPFPGDGRPEGAQAIARAFRLLRAIARGPQKGWRLGELAGVAGLRDSTARRILLALVREGMVTQDPRTRLYHLGRLAFEFGLAPNPFHRTIRLCEDHLRALAAETGDSAFLSMRSGNELVCLIRSEGHYPIRASMVSVGERLPLGVGGLGVSLLAGLGDGECARLLDSLEPDFGRYPGLERSIVEDRIRECRALGHSNYVDQPMPGVQSIGMAIANGSDPPVLGIATVAIVQRFSPEHLRRTIRALRRCAARVGQIHAGQTAGRNALPGPG